MKNNIQVFTYDLFCDARLPSLLKIFSVHYLIWKLFDAFDLRNLLLKYFMQERQFILGF